MSEQTPSPDAAVTAPAALQGTDALGDVDDTVETEGTERKKISGWYPRLLAWFVQRRYEHGVPAVEPQERARPQSERARRAIRRACVKSMLTGASAGVVSTGATVATAQTEGALALVAAPVAAAAVGGEMIYRAMVHLELTCELADIFEVRFDAKNPDDLWRLFALIFKAEQHRNDDDPGKDLVHRVMHVEGEQVGEAIGAKLLGESVVRNLIPVVGIASSSITNWMLTQRLGDTVRRYMRYQRALGDALAALEKVCGEHFDLFIEGLWFLFSADGRLSHEEAAVLANLLMRCDPIERQAIAARFDEDEIDWIERLSVIPDNVREPFLYAMEVAGAVDKSVSLPERKILRRTARALGLPFDPERAERMMKSLDAVGVLEA